MLELDLSQVEPSVAGPKRPQDRVGLFQARQSFEDALPSLAKPKKKAAAAAPRHRQAPSPPTSATRRRRRAAPEVKNGSVVIAAITSCTNTSNPSVLVAAGLLAKNAVEKGLSTKPWVKTSLAPGSKVVTEYLAEAGLTPYLETLKFHTVGYGCTTCIGNSGPLPQPISDAIEARDLVVASVLSGNRNFEGRINPDVRANYLMSPPLVVAFALAGRIDIDLDKEPLGEGDDGEPVFLRDIWPSANDVSTAVSKAIKPAMFQKSYAVVFEGDEHWRKLDVPLGETYVWDEASTYIKHPPYFEGLTKAPGQIADIKGARVLAMLGDSVTTDHISPAGSIKKDGPAGQYLIAHGVDAKDFNSYGARRGNHEVMVRGTFANVRLKNLLAPGTEGGVTRHLPDGAPMSIFDASERYAREGVPLMILAGKEYGSGSSRDWAAKGPRLLGVRAVIAESYERIHRSNLVGMGIVPLQFRSGDSAASLGLTGEEVFETVGLPALLESGFASGASSSFAPPAPTARPRRSDHRPDRHAARGRLLPARRYPSLRAAAVDGLMIEVAGGAAFTPARLQKRLTALRRANPGIRALTATFTHFVDVEGIPSQKERLLLERLLRYGPRATTEVGRSTVAFGRRLLVVPRIGTISPWSSKATDIARICGLTRVRRIERGISYVLVGEASDDAALERVLADRMTESVLTRPGDVARLFERTEPRPLARVALGSDARAALARANQDFGLALSPDEIDYLADAYRTLGRDPTDVELMMFAQANSEHCRHKIFNADFVIAGERQPLSLFQMIRRSTEASPAGVLSAYHDNAAVIEGAPGGRFAPDPVTAVYRAQHEPMHILMKVETHNHPTAISPFPGAATGSGGEIRDEGATGRGARPKAGLTGFSVSNLRLPGNIRPWEGEYGKPDRIASALDIMIEGPLGGAAFNNEFGRPNLCGYFRTFELEVPGPSGPEVRGYHKPIMVAGGFGNARPELVKKAEIPPGAPVVVLGGPAMLIGLGGGAASSLASGSSQESLDFASVQRDNAEMQRRCQEVIDRCASLGADNPILSIHDVGAGGLSNALPELVHDSGRGARFDLRAIPTDEPGLSPLELWCNEAQERYVLAIAPATPGAFHRHLRARTLPARGPRPGHRRRPPDRRRSAGGRSPDRHASRRPAGQAAPHVATGVASVPSRRRRST